MGKANYLEVSASTTTPLAGADNQLTIEVYKSDDSLDTDFTESYNISISGYTPAPDGSFGKVDGDDLEESPAQVSLAFNSGVATLNLALNSAEEQTIVLEVEDVFNPTPDEPLKITPKHGAEKELRIITQPQPAMREGVDAVLFSVQPILKLYDKFGNLANTSDIEVMAAKEGAGDWALGGTQAISADNGIVEYTDLTAQPDSDDDVFDAQIKFTAGTLSVTSEKFNFVGLSAPVQTAPEHGSHENSPGLALTWDEVDGAEKYLVQIAGDNLVSDTEPEPVEVSATSYDVSDMGEGQYFWRVRSSKTVDEVEILSSWSPTWEFTIDDTPPTGVELTIQSMTKDNKVTVKLAAEEEYTENSDIEFTLEVSLTEDFGEIDSEIFHGTGDHDLSANLDPNARYFFKVKAQDDAGNVSDYSDVISTVTYANKPDQVQAEANMKTMELEISWNSNGNPDGTKYRIEIVDSKSGDIIKEKVTLGSPDETGKCTYSFSGIEKGKRYEYGIASLNSVGMESDFVDAHTVIPDWPVFTGPLFNLPEENTYITSPETTTFSWTPVENHDSVQYYEIQFADDKEFKVNPNEMSVGTGTSSDFFSGNEEQAWYLRIRAVYNELEQSDWSDALGDVFIYSVSTTPPTMDSLEDSAERHSITLTAEISEGLAPFREDPYRYEVSTHSDFSLIEEDSDWIAASDYTFNELLTGATYYYKVSARDISGHILESTGSISTDAIALEVSTEIEQVETVAGGKITFTLPPVSLGVYAEVLAPTASDLAKISAANAKLTDENYSVDIVAPRDYHFLDGRGRPVAPADFDDSTDKISIRMEYSKDFDAQEASALRIARLNTATSEWEILPEAKTNHNPKEKWVEASLDSLSIYALVMAPLSVDVKEVYVYPNPFKPGDATFGALGGSGIVIAGLPEGARVRVFTIAGELVEEFTTSVGGDYRWAKAEDLASGVYLMVVTYDGDSKTLKFAVVK